MKTGSVVLAVCMLFSMFGCAKNDDHQSDALEQTAKSDSALPSDTTGRARASDTARTIDSAYAFQIDLKQSGRLDFARFVKDFPQARLRLSFEIDSDGRVVRTFDEYNGGHPAAMDRFQKSVRNWRYQGGCLKGTICIEVNTSSARVTIDDSRLQVVSGFENRVIERGRMHGFFGGEVRVMKGNLSR